MPDRSTDSTRDPRFLFYEIALAWRITQFVPRCRDLDRKPRGFPHSFAPLEDIARAGFFWLANGVINKLHPKIEFEIVAQYRLKFCDVFLKNERAGVQKSGSIKILKFSHQTRHTNSLSQIKSR